MPNGYTAGIYDGEQSLRDFLMGVGRGMGFAVMQRDDPMDEPVKRQPESTYYTRSLVTAREDLARLEALTPETARPLAEAAYSEAMDRYRETKRDKLALRARYDDMERQVLAWDPPAEIHGTLPAFGDDTQPPLTRPRAYRTDRTEASTGSDEMKRSM